mmetsp:Transcript_160455/g.515037  ORF Transcript_160455/g.515037 Transcript_160455/m.515037 type:complete len:282 (-) Transcript_160455:532-1377(-)
MLTRQGSHSHQVSRDPSDKHCRVSMCEKPLHASSVLWRGEVLPAVGLRCLVVLLEVAFLLRMMGASFREGSRSRRRAPDVRIGAAPVEGYALLVAQHDPPSGSPTGDLEGFSGMCELAVGAVEGPDVDEHRDAPFVSNLAVAPLARRRGAARRLLVQCEDVARSWGYDEIFLDALPCNTAAGTLYESSGYHVDGSTPPVDMSTWHLLAGTRSNRWRKRLTDTSPPLTVGSTDRARHSNATIAQLTKRFLVEVALSLGVCAVIDVVFETFLDTFTSTSHISG